jgi:hypothetical protein
MLREKRSSKREGRLARGTRRVDVVVEVEVDFVDDMLCFVRVAEFLYFLNGLNVCMLCVYIGKCLCVWLNLELCLGTL